MVYEQADWSKLEGTGGAGEEGEVGAISSTGC